MRRTTFFLLFIVATFSSFAQQQGSERFTRVINRLVEAMNNQDYAAILHEYDNGMATMFPLFKTTYFFKNNYDTFGKVIRVDSQQVKARDQVVCIMYFERGAQEVTLYINDQEKIKGFLFAVHFTPEPSAVAETKPAQTQTANLPKTEEVKPAPAQATDQTSTKEANSPVSGEQKPVPVAGSNLPLIATPAQPVVTDKQQTELYPPFKGTWIVITGGEARDDGAQRNLLQQQYAYEFSELDASGLRYKNDGKTIEEYIGYGKEVLAPANGTVVEVIDGINENSFGIRNQYAIIGNTIIIRHSDSEYSVLSFLKQGSIQVKLGDVVTRGQVIGRCGCSGNAAEPMIHYHLQDSPSMQTAKAIKFYFERVMVNKEGKRELKIIHLPKVGDVISPE